jgi:hypothetical protein
MRNIVFLIAFLALPALSYLWVRSITWLVIWIFASAAVVSSFVDFTIRNGQHWDLPSLQFALLVSLLIVAVAALVSRRLRPGAGIRSQAIAIGAPVAVALIFIIISRLLAIGHAGPWSAVGYFVQRISAEDNAKWLDFSGQLLSGDPVNQAVPLGGPLQLAVIFAATVFDSSWRIPDRPIPKVKKCLSEKLCHVPVKPRNYTESHGFPDFILPWHEPVHTYSGSTSVM